MVLGGYDASRVDGNFTTFPVADGSESLPCPLQVNVTGLIFARQPLLNGSEVMIACIEPYVQRFVFTPAIANSFAQITGQNATLYSGMDYDAANTPPGDLTITLSTGYNTTITNSELFTLRRGSDQYGRYAITNASVVEAGISDSRNKDPASQTLTLGGLFLTFNYLVMDYEQMEFRLAAAVASDVDTGTTLQTVCTRTATPSAKPSPAPSPKYSTLTTGNPRLLLTCGQAPNQYCRNSWGGRRRNRRSCSHRQCDRLLPFPKPTPSPPESRPATYNRDGLSSHEPTIDE